MKKLMMILLSVILLMTAGCGNKKTDVITSTEPTESVVEDRSDTEKVTETETTTDSEEEETETTDTDNKEETNAQTVTDDSDSNVSHQSENSQTKKSSHESSDTQNLNTDNTQPVQNQTQEPEQTEPALQQEQQVISYSPQNVVALATAKTKAAGKVLLTENLDSLLANGQISQEEYNEYYPYDGAGYYSVFVDTNMAEARSVSGTTSFNSEDEIAQYISDMLVLENGPYFLIEYAGTYDYYGKQCYEFRCYRA